VDAVKQQFLQRIFLGTGPTRAASARMVLSPGGRQWPRPPLAGLHVGDHKRPALRLGGDIKRHDRAHRSQAPAAAYRTPEERPRI